MDIRFKMLNLSFTIKKQLDLFHPKLAIFIAEAMKIFADSELN